MERSLLLVASRRGYETGFVADGRLLSWERIDFQISDSLRSFLLGVGEGFGSSVHVGVDVDLFFYSRVRIMWERLGVIPVISAGSGGRLWLSEASRLTNSSRLFTTRLPISSIKLKVAAFILVSSLSGTSLFWKQPDMVVAVKATRLLHGSRRDSGVYSLGGLQVMMRSSEASYVKGDSGNPGIRGNEENLTFSGSSPMVENSN
ncbi:hypothetical protein DY000_02023088 [Brassica cretica]|uniref:Uncharacterized protein n=1 Tax=Brassica cretica TaxID=69181 RepID=A0ABQ7EIN5_BRACR|nr:hypothetical protein DY000_02023088 [Brassica cretica]